MSERADSALESLLKNGRRCCTLASTLFLLLQTFARGCKGFYSFLCQLLFELQFCIDTLHVLRLTRTQQYRAPGIPWDKSSDNVQRIYELGCGSVLYINKDIEGVRSEGRKTNSGWTRVAEPPESALGRRGWQKDKEVDQSVSSVTSVTSAKSFLFYVQTHPRDFDEGKSRQ